LHIVRDDHHSKWRGADLLSQCLRQSQQAVEAERLQAREPFEFRLSLFIGCDGPEMDNRLGCSC